MIVVLADGLEEAFPEGHANEKERDNLIRRAIQHADEQNLPLVIASRPHHPLEATAAAIIELEPLSEEAALDYVERDSRTQDEHRLDWIVETADVADAPLYLQIARRLYEKGMLEHLTPSRDHGHLDTRGGDCSALRWRLLDTWRKALAEGHLYPEVVLSTKDRTETIRVVSALACVGLLKDTLEVTFEDLIGNVGKGVQASPVRDRQYRPERSTAAQEIWNKLRKDAWGESDADEHALQLDIHRYLSLVSLAATRGEQLGLVESYGNRVRFFHSLLQAYLGSWFLDVLTDDDLRTALKAPLPGRELLITLVLQSRAATQARVPNLARMLLDAAEHHYDAKAFDIYAAALEIDSVQDSPIQGEIAEKLLQHWGQIRTGDRRTLEEGKLGVVQRFGDALREVARRNHAEPAYKQFFQIGYAEESYPIRLAIAQEIGSGGDKAFDALDYDFGDPLDEYLRRKSGKRSGPCACCCGA